MVCDCPKAPHPVGLEMFLLAESGALLDADYPLASSACYTLFAAGVRIFFAV
jgi:hypothetical protein